MLGTIPLISWKKLNLYGIFLEFFLIPAGWYNPKLSDDKKTWWRLLFGRELISPANYSIIHQNCEDGILTEGFYITSSLLTAGFLSRNIKEGPVGVDKPGESMISETWSFRGIPTFEKSANWVITNHGHCSSERHLWSDWNALSAVFWVIRCRSCYTYVYSIHYTV